MTEQKMIDKHLSINAITKVPAGVAQGIEACNRSRNHETKRRADALRSRQLEEAITLQTENWGDLPSEWRTSLIDVGPVNVCRFLKFARETFQ